MNAQDPPASAAVSPTADPFNSYEDLLAAHSKLNEAATDEPVGYAAINQFLIRAVSTGHQLDSPADRKQAQGLIDYWASTIYTDYRRAEALDAPARQTLRLADFDAESVKSVVSRADVVVDRMAPAGRELVRQVMLAVAPLPSKGGRSESKSVHLGKLLSIDSGQDVMRVLRILEEAGVLKSNGDDWSLRHAALVRQWSKLREWLDNRRRFRDAVTYWERNGESKAALIGGPLLAKAERFGDLNEHEIKFLSASRSRQYRSWLVFCATVAAALALALTTAIVLMRRAEHEAEQAKTALEKANAEERASEATKKAIEQSSIAAAATRKVVQYSRAAAQERSLVAAVKADGLKLSRDASETQRDLSDYFEAILRDSDITSTMSAEKRNFYSARLGELRRVQSALQPFRSKQQKLRPGVSIGLDRSAVGGSACCLVVDPNSPARRYLLTAHSALDGDTGDGVIQPMAVDGGTSADAIGTFARASGKVTHWRSAALVELQPGVDMVNSIDGIGDLRGIHDQPHDGQGVVLVGRGSGRIEGTVVSKRDGAIIVRLPATLGDVGGAVVTGDGMMVGMLSIPQPDGTHLVAPLRPLLQELGVAWPDQPRPDGSNPGANHAR